MTGSIEIPELLRRLPEGIEADKWIVLVLVFAAAFSILRVFLPYLMSRRNTVSKHSSGAAETGYTAGGKRMSPEDLQRLRISLSFIFASAGVAVVIGLGLYWLLPVVIVISVFLYHLPNLIARQRHRLREMRFDTEMLDFTVLVANALRSGIALPAAIELAMDTVGGIVREEFSIVMREHRLGVELAEAIEHLGTRISSENFQLFSATICVTLRTGGSIADVLERIVETIRSRSEFYEKLKTMISQTKFEAICIAVMPFAAFVILFLLNPDFMRPLVTTVTGWIAIAVVLVLEVVGFLVLRHVSRIEV